MAVQSFPDGAATRSLVLAEAKTWIGTPYRHQSSRKQVGCDCLGLIAGIWRALYTEQLNVPADYPRSWNARSDGDDPLLDAAKAYLSTLPNDEGLPGDLIVFRWSVFAPSRHLAIVAEGDTIIHAYERHAVMQNALVPSWRRRVSGVFRFPDPA